MTKFLSIAILIAFLLSHGIDMATASTVWGDQDFFKQCPWSRCSKNGPEIRFPLQLESSNSSCGATCVKIECSGQDTVLLHPFLGPFNVTAIDYSRATLSIAPLVQACHKVQKFISQSVPANSSHQCSLYGEPGKLLGCSREIPPIHNFMASPFSCLSNATHFSYLVNAKQPVYVLPLNCRVISDVVIPILGSPELWQLEEEAQRFYDMKVCWYTGSSSVAFNCTRCEQDGRPCAFSSQRNQTFCVPHPHGSHVKIIAATSSGVAFVVLVLMVATALYLSLKTRYNREIHLKVEMFLNTHGKSKTTRYTFSEVKKMARRFKVNLGRGGYGSVYKGELPNGIPVAVKMLENSIGEGQEFINEVATIGLIHHTNIVRLLGFCYEGTRRALIYEFMPNESLEKYIFSRDSNIFQTLLVPEKMLDIALGIARGMEYLHQGCNQRILHFDIKPHNILLDYNFNPKISDFGLAKLCARDQSIITLTAARGTMGYIAPELYSRNFGGISHKSDVYSFGMLVLEMVSGRRTSDPRTESQNEVYLPECIYELVIARQDLALTGDTAEEEKEKVRKLATVALWCIQWNPKDRPSMTKVVNMLTGRFQNLQMPPRPYVQSENHAIP
ncbi:unnamed protein product [Triticum turgidum subsp. durum]|uniref:non-specific serine/threonine protein kinase n=1 Tax=Triticum turgidum subsp. durum TaxID=4567 RepID=A0A9R0XNZ4_TRITD|nr:unnamed protein product [Triticum turgidum subsp. durum]